MYIEWHSTHDLILILKHLKKLDRKVNSFWYSYDKSINLSKRFSEAAK